MNTIEKDLVALKQQLKNKKAALLETRNSFKYRIETALINTDLDRYTFYTFQGRTQRQTVINNDLFILEKTLSWMSSDKFGRQVQKVPKNNTRFQQLSLSMFNIEIRESRKGVTQKTRNYISWQQYWWHHFDSYRKIGQKFLFKFTRRKFISISFLREIISAEKKDFDWIKFPYV